MMFWAFTGVAWLGVVLNSALLSRIHLGHVGVDPALVVITFVALRRDIISGGLLALVVGYLCGRQALAPLGTYELGCVITAVAVYLTSGNIAGSGRNFFAMAVGGAEMLHQLVLFFLGWLRDGAGFASYWAAALVPGAILSAGLGWLAFPFLVALEQKLATDKRQELSWH